MAGRIDYEQLSPDLQKMISVDSDSDTLAGQPASYYDQNAHTKDTNIHITSSFREKVDNAVSKEDADKLHRQSLLQANTYTDEKLAQLIQNNPSVYSAMMQIVELLAQNPDTLQTLLDVVGSKASNEDFTSHIIADNPHGVSKATIGLENANNTADEDKVVAKAGALTEARKVTFGGNITGQFEFDGSKDVNVQLEYTPSETEDVMQIPGEYRQVTVNSKGQVIAGSNPTTLAGYGIVDAATSEQGKRADKAITGITVGIFGDVSVTPDGVALLPAYPTDAATLGGSKPEEFAKNELASLEVDGLLSKSGYLRLYGTPVDMDCMNMVKGNKDAWGKFTNVQYFATFVNDETGEWEESLYKESTLIGDGPNYPERTEVIYVDKLVITRVYKLEYDVDGDVVSERVISDEVRTV